MNIQKRFPIGKRVTLKETFEVGKVTGYMNGLTTGVELITIEMGKKVRGKVVTRVINPEEIAWSAGCDAFK